MKIMFRLFNFPWLFQNNVWWVWKSSHALSIRLISWVNSWIIADWSILTCHILTYPLSLGSRFCRKIEKEEALYTCNIFTLKMKVLVVIWYGKKVLFRIMSKLIWDHVPLYFHVCTCKMHPYALVANFWSCSLIMVWIFLWMEQCLLLIFSVNCFFYIYWFDKRQYCC